MPCYHPVRAYTAPAGGVTFKSPTAHDGNPIDLPCGQCIGCKLQRSSDWALRCTHEAQLHPVNSFCTFTYSDEALPPGGSLRYRDFQLFLMRLRTKYGKGIRFYMCGEYGDTTFRPHYHALLFGWTPPDGKFWSNNPQGDRVYTSEILDKLWGHGQCQFGAVTRQSAGYVARYTHKKITGDLAAAHYGGRVPEFGQMSRRPGIGARWLDRFRHDVFPCDYVVDADGNKHHVPKYYDRRNAKHDAGLLEQVKEDRAQAALPGRADNTPSRLRVKEVVKLAAISQLTRQL